MSQTVNSEVRRGRVALAAPALALVPVVLVLAWTGGGILDPDVWWHVRTGRLVLDDLSVPHTDPWSFTAPADGWVPTAWLSDVVFALAWHAGGYDGVRVLRIVLAALVVAALWLVARRFAGTTARAAAGAAVVLLAVAPFLRERPQVVSYLFVAWLAVLVQRVLAGERPPLIATVALTYLWANLHGMWVLAPVSILGAGVLAWHDDRGRVSLAARCTLVSLLGAASVLLTPVGPRLAWWPLVVQDVAGAISEWQPTVPLSATGAPLLVLVTVILVGWARQDQAVPVSRVVLVVAVTVFGLMAFRNVAPAAILLLPELVRGGEPRADRPPLAPRAGLVALTVGVALGLVRLTATDTTASDTPTRLAAALAARSGEIRVLNHYDVGGLLTGTASPPVLVAIDGRTDMWSEDYVRGYLDDVAGTGDWRSLVDRLAPDAAVLPTDSEVARGLVLERGWRVTLVDGSWSLLEPAG